MFLSGATRIRANRPARFCIPHQPLDRLIDSQPLDLCTWTTVNNFELLIRSGPCDQLTRSSQPSNLFTFDFQCFLTRKKSRKNFEKILINPELIQIGILRFYFIYLHIYILLYIILFVKFYLLLYYYIVYIIYIIYLHIIMYLYIIIHLLFKYLLKYRFYMYITFKIFV